jgi:hypothetical protein
MASAIRPDAPFTLNGWKDIAAYLGKSVRSVQRWERELGLPVHRINTPDGGQIVFANQIEIDAWKRTQEAEKRQPDDADAAATGTGTASRPRWTGRLTGRVACLVLGAAFGATAVALIRFAIPGRPERFELEGNTLTAYTQAGTPVWTYAFGRTVHHPNTSRTFTTRGDVDGDGSTDVVATVRYAPPTSKSTFSDAVLAFRSDGSLIWQIQPVLQISHKGQTFDGPWQAFDVRISPDRARPRVWIAYNHQTWRPAFVLEVEPDGRNILRYAQSGWLHALQYWQTAAGTFLAVAGVGNEYSRASVALVDVAGEPAQSVPNDDGPLACEGCPRASPHAFFLFPPSELTALFHRPYSWAKRLAIDGPNLKVATDEGFGEGSLATLSPALRIVAFERADRYWQAHRTFEREGRLAHTAEDCPERDTTHEMQVWTTGKGWTHYAVAFSVAPPVDHSGQ